MRQRVPSTMTERSTEPRALKSAQSSSSSNSRAVSISCGPVNMSPMGASSPRIRATMTVPDSRCKSLAPSLNASRTRSLKLISTSAAHRQRAAGPFCSALPYDRKGAPSVPRFLVVATAQRNYGMRMSWPGRNVMTQIEVEVLVQLHVITGNVDHVDFHVALCIDHATGDEIFDEKVIGHDDPPFVTRQTQIVRARIQTEVYDTRLGIRAHRLRTFRITDVEHHHLACLPRKVERDKKASSCLVDQQQLRPDRRIRYRLYGIGAEIEDGPCCPGLGIDEVQMVVVHPRRE